MILTSTSIRPRRPYPVIYLILNLHIICDVNPWFGSSANRTKTMSNFVFRDKLNVNAEAGAGRTPDYLPTTSLIESVF